jgi:hypothetical protein
MRRVFTFTSVLIAALVIGAAPALAGFCFVENKPVGPGQQAIIDFTDPTFESFEILNKSAEHRNENSFSEDGTPKIAGFLGVDLDGDGTADAEFLIPGNPDGHLPEGALQAGPGDSQCDGHGVGNVFACLFGGEPEH